MTDATNSPYHGTDGSTAKDSHSQPAGSAKAESNRRNAQKSTGPRTEAGKANSRLNALKHGILASQEVITMIDGREHRAEFEAMVDGLAEDFQPVGTLEQLLVQDIAACFWRKRRLLRFENRAAFEANDRRTHNLMNRVRQTELQPRYTLEGSKVEADDILDEAGLGLDLPSEADCNRVVRYEGSITRTLKFALAKLEARQKKRMASHGANPSAFADRDVVVDTRAQKVNAGRAHGRLGAKLSLLSHALDFEDNRVRLAEEEAEVEAELREIAQDRLAALLGPEYKTKPKSPANPGPRARRAPRPTDQKAPAQGPEQPSAAPPPASK